MSDILDKLNKELESFTCGTDWIKVGGKRFKLSNITMYEEDHNSIKCWFGRNDCRDIPKNEFNLNFLDKYFKPRNLQENERRF